MVREGHLTEREKYVVEKYIGLSDKRRRKSTLKEVGNTIGLTRERVRQILDEAIGKIKHRISEIG